MNYLVLAIILFAIYGSGQLSLQDWKKKNVCPKILFIPACYIVFFLFVIVGIIHVFPALINQNLFFIAIGIIGAIALKGSLTELAGKKICPRSSNGTPMCYYSLGLSVGLIILKTINLIMEL